MCRCHVQIAADLVNHDNLACIPFGLLKRKCGAFPGITFGGDQGLFLRDQPRRRMARAMVQELRGVL